ncbi:MAG TPA: FAD-binding oxidoreductase, partial [Candidatus Binatia bacterium]|nr:FAD-binding oxidoreductase [Candidatus Binatia bacterium]
MAKSTRYQPKWREDVPGERSYRSVLKYDPKKFKHPSFAWYEMFKREFAMTDDDFRERRPGGDGEVVLDRPCGLSESQVRAFAEIVGRENVSTAAYDRVKFGHGKSVDENLALRRGAVGMVPDLVVHPRDKTEVAGIVALCNEQRIPIATYGGGS